VRIEIEGLDDFRNAGDANKARAAISSALNKTARATRAEAQRQIRARYTVKSALIRKRSFLKKSTKNTLKASVWFGGDPIGSQYFQIGQNRRAAWARIKKGSRVVFDRAFKWKNAAGRMMLLQRKTSAGNSKLRDPVRDVERPSVAKMAMDGYGAIRRATDAALARNMRAEFDYRFRARR